MAVPPDSWARRICSTSSTRVILVMGCLSVWDRPATQSSSQMQGTVRNPFHAEKRPPKEPLLVAGPLGAVRAARLQTEHGPRLGDLGRRPAPAGAVLVHDLLGLGLGHLAVG